MFSKDLAIDLGTANTIVYTKNKGVVINEPSVVALDTKTGEIIAVGDEAKNMIGRTPANISAIRPLKDGVIADFDVTAEMLRYFINQTNTGMHFYKPRIIVCVPSGATDVEKRAIIEATVSAGANEKQAYLIEEPMAAAIGAGLNVEGPEGSMIVDIGGGTSEVAVISLGGIVTSASVRVAGDAFDNAIINHIKKQYSLAIGDRTAEDVKIRLACAYKDNFDDIKTMEIRGRDLVSGLPNTVEVNSREIMEAIEEPVSTIVEAIKTTLEKTPPELSADIMETGIYITGGGALLYGLDILIENETGMPVHIADEPLFCVVKGTGIALENAEIYKNCLITTRKLKI